ncbi:MAG: ATP-dependent DNA helicase [Myxococcota bacterium]|nr:ATP-dependent DNA helicase [Myxococcota bacterium]
MAENISPEKINDFFSSDGPLKSTIPHYEIRDEQKKFAIGIAQAIQNEENLFAEAGTGTGKTLGYLVPAILSGLKVIISTGTKNLQEQILAKDIPITAQALGRTISVELLKGRSNYLCHARADQFLAQGVIPGSQLKKHLEIVREWREVTHTGDRAELKDLPENFDPWRHMSATSEQCPARSCPEYEACWVTRTRRRAQQADIVIVNHHLYFADAALRSQLGNTSQIQLIPPHDVVIFDEAHDIDEVVSNHFGIEVSERRLTSLIRDIETEARNSKLDLEELRNLLTRIEIAHHKLFSAIPFNLGQKKRIAKQDLTSAITENFSTVRSLLMLVENSLFEERTELLVSLARRCSVYYRDLAFLLFHPQAPSILYENPEITPEEDIEHLEDDLFTSENTSTTSELETFEKFVHYSEGHMKNRRLVARPLEVSTIIPSLLAKKTSIFVSATLAMGGRFKYFHSKIGIQPKESIIVESPFQYEKQMRYFIPSKLAAPRTPRYQEEMEDTVSDLVRISQGGAFVLCTSYSMLNTLASFLDLHSEFTVLKQGDKPKNKLLQDFISDGNAVLIATMSFWQGVDVPGAALRLVIIDKLPFASPYDPLVQARLDYLEKSGCSPFMDYQVPQAAILLRQGVGRLIRTRLDRGVVGILDSRLTQRHYGRQIQESLPKAPILNHLEDVHSFFSNQDHLNNVID